jgi:hypothetical protein
MEEKKIWMNKKVYVRISNLNRAYSGRVIEEDDFSITIIDINGKRVLINKKDAAFIQEEKE